MIARKTIDTGKEKIKLRLVFSMASIILFPNIAFGQNNFEESKLILEPVLLSSVDQDDSSLLNSFTLEGSEIVDAGNLIEQSLSRTLDISQYEQAIEELETSMGPYAVDLAEQLDSLGRIYQETGDHESAIEFFEKSKHITRVNNGLFSLNQLATEENIIASYQAMGDIKTVDELREYMFYIKRKNYSENDPEMPALNREWAEWNVESLLRMYNVPTASLPLFNSGNESLRAKDYILIYDGFNATFISRNRFNNSAGSTRVSDVNMSILIEPRLKEARTIYEDMLKKARAKLSANGGDTVYSPEIQDLQRILSDISFIVKDKMERMGNETGEYSIISFGSKSFVESAQVVNRGYQASRDAFKEIVEALKSLPDTKPLDLALAILDLADWNLIFSHEISAETLYEEAYIVLKDSGMAVAEIESIIAPEAELPLPVYSVHQFSRQMQGLNRASEISYKGYIDIEYRLDRYGKRKSLKVLKVSEGSPPRLRRVVLDHLETQRVRPIIKDGLVMRDIDVQLRYYYTY